MIRGNDFILNPDKLQEEFHLAEVSDWVDFSTKEKLGFYYTVLLPKLKFEKVKVVNQMKGNTSHGFRKQFLTDEALKILHKAKELNPNGIYVFEPNGEIMTTDSFNRRLKKYCKEAGVPYHSSHKIRFYNASTAFDGNNLTTLSYLMGHSETATTLHYLRNVNKKKNDRLASQNLGISS